MLLRFENLHKSFGGQTVLDGISGEIRQGEVILLRGENGSGKTTLLNILTGCLEPDNGEIMILDSGFKILDSKSSGVPNSLFGNQESKISASTHHSSLITHHFTFPPPSLFHRLKSLFSSGNSSPITHRSSLNSHHSSFITHHSSFCPEVLSRLGIGRTWQDVRLFGSLDLADNIAVAEPDESDSPWAALFRPRKASEFNRLHRQSAADTLAELGLRDRDTSSADRISLGQSKRVAIARALHARARILFLDEPLAGLDADGIRDVLAHLRTLAAEHGLTLVIIEHVLNIPRLLDFVTSVWTLENGHLTTTEPAVIRQELANTASAIDIHTLIRQALQHEVPITTQTLPLGAKLTTYWLADPEQSQTATPVLEVKKLTLQRGNRHIFTDSDKDGFSGLTLRLQQGTLNVIEAPNGWGKTSLMKRLIGYLKQESGTVTMKDTPLPDMANAPVFYRLGGRALLSEVGLFPSLTEAETAILARVANREVSSHRHADSLSGGELRQLAIECLGTASVLFMDEFFQGLDRTRSATLLKLVLSNSKHRMLFFLQPSTSSNS